MEEDGVPIPRPGTVATAVVEVAGTELPVGLPGDGTQH